jgi:hypothetical protein
MWLARAKREGMLEATVVVERVKRVVRMRVVVFILLDEKGGCCGCRKNCSLCGREYWLIEKLLEV